MYFTNNCLHFIIVPLIDYWFIFFVANSCRDHQVRLGLVVSRERRESREHEVTRERTERSDHLVTQEQLDRLAHQDQQD